VGGVFHGTTDRCRVVWPSHSTNRLHWQTLRGSYSLIPTGMLAHKRRTGLSHSSLPDLLSLWLHTFSISACVKLPPTLRSPLSSTLRVPSGLCIVMHIFRQSPRDIEPGNMFNSIAGTGRKVSCAEATSFRIRTWRACDRWVYDVNSRSTCVHAIGLEHLLSRAHEGSSAS